jgi:hypothetical protein
VGGPGSLACNQKGQGQWRPQRSTACFPCSLGHLLATAPSL